MKENISRRTRPYQPNDPATSGGWDARKDAHDDGGNARTKTQAVREGTIHGC